MPVQGHTYSPGFAHLEGEFVQPAHVVLEEHRCRLLGCRGSELVRQFGTELLTHTRPLGHVPHLLEFCHQRAFEVIVLPFVLSVVGFGLEHAVTVCVTLGSQFLAFS